LITIEQAPGANYCVLVFEPTGERFGHIEERFKEFMCQVLGCGIFVKGVFTDGRD